jgi:copper resistance protein D
MEDGLSLLLFSQGLHLLATGAWLGGLVPLLIVVREAAPKAATQALALFRSRCSLRCRDYGNRMVAGLASRRWRERPDRNSLWLGALKIVLFAALFALAALNRFLLTPALPRRHTQSARRTLICTIAAESTWEC